MKRILLTVSILTIFLTACSGQATPTAAPVDIQGTAVSAASTIMAATQMAMPTATLVPPTDIPLPTPLPTFTPDLSMPTLPPPVILPSATATSMLGGTSTLGECNRLIDVAVAGPTVPVRIQNLTGGVALVSLYLNKNTFGQCGYMPSVTVRGAATVQLPTGSWYFYALVDYGKGKSGKSYGNFIVQPGGADLVKILKR